MRLFMHVSLIFEGVFFQGLAKSKIQILMDIPLLWHHLILGELFKSSFTGASLCGAYTFATAPCFWRRLMCWKRGAGPLRDVFFVYKLLISNMYSIRNRSVLFSQFPMDLFANQRMIVDNYWIRIDYPPLSAAILRSGGKSHHVTPSSWFFWVGYNFVCWGCLDGFT